jgi:hypothetical protein
MSPLLSGPDLRRMEMLELLAFTLTVTAFAGPLAALSFSRS